MPNCSVEYAVLATEIVSMTYFYVVMCVIVYVHYSRFQA